MNIIQNPEAYDAQAVAFVRHLVEILKRAAYHPHHNVQNPERLIEDLAFSITNLIDGTQLDGLTPYFTFCQPSDGDEAPLALIEPGDYLHELVFEVLDEEEPES